MTRHAGHARAGFTAMCLPRFFGISRGGIRFTVSVRRKPAVDIILRGRDIVIEICDPLAAMELGIRHFVSGKRGRLGPFLLRKLRALGFRMKVRYKLIEFEV